MIISTTINLITSITAGTIIMYCQSLLLSLLLLVILKLNVTIKLTLAWEGLALANLFMISGLLGILVHFLQ